MKWFLIGSIMIGLSGPLVGKYAFQGELLPVFTGFVFFVTGYRVIQFENHENNDLDWTSFRDNSTGFISGELMLLLGILLASYGFLIGADATSSLEVSGMAFSGLLVVSGYITGHIGGNNAVL